MAKFQNASVEHVTLEFYSIFHHIFPLCVNHLVMIGLILIVSTVVPLLRDHKKSP